jgi:hypothetical protein
MIMDIIDKNTFKQKYINTDFDKILIDNNNHLINSYNYYIQYKNQYLKQSNDNLYEYISISDELNHLIELERIVISKTKIIYTYIDKQRFIDAKSSLQKILNNQELLYKNFITYIDMLNKNKDKYVISENDKININNYDNDNIDELNNIQELKKTTRPKSILSIESGKRPSSIKSVDISTSRKASSVKSFDITNKRPKSIFAKIKNRN